MFKDIIEEFANMYSIDTSYANELINAALSKTYNSALPVVISEKNILVTTLNQGIYQTKNIVISKAKEKMFKENLFKKIERIELAQHKIKLQNTLKISDNIVFGRVYNKTSESIIFELYNIKKQKINNTYLIVMNNNLFNLEYNFDDKLHYMYVQSKAHPLVKNSKYYYYAYAKNQRVIASIIKNIFNKINKALKTSLSFSKIFYNQKNNTITVTLNNSFIDKTTIDLLKLSTIERMNLDIILITNRKENK